MDTNSDQDKEIQPVNDCKGTCKTPQGCTCGKQEPLQKDEPTVEKVLEKPVVEKKANAEPAAPKVAEPNKQYSLLHCNGKQCCPGKKKLEVYDWMWDMPPVVDGTQMVEVQFKNTRKGYYLNSNNLEVYKGDIVAVEATPGHDIGEVTMTGKLVQLQMKKANIKGEIKRVYRIARPNDMEKYQDAKSREHKTMLRSREIAEELNLNMKISDVEYQGDGNKVIFYYIADERVDFRQLIKVYASEFRVKIEMKQIGARQEAGRVGGIGPCGRELCCSSSMSNFISVSTSAARLQDIPLNPQKLAGQCGKLKCCLNFEVDTYVEAQGKLPSRDIQLETKDATYYIFKVDVLSGMMMYSTDRNFPANLVTLHKDRVWEIVKMNRRGEKPLYLQTQEKEQEDKRNMTHDLLEQASITRFDSSDNGNRTKKKRKPKSVVNRVGDGNVPKNEARPQNAAPNNNNKPQPNKFQPNRGNNNNNKRQQEANVSSATEPQDGGKKSLNMNNQNNRNRRNNNRSNRNRPQQNEKQSPSDNA